MPRDLPVSMDFTLEHRYTARPGERGFLTGTQALVRVVLDQSGRDRAAGLNTAGFVSGYRGSPLGAFDMEMWRAGRALDQADIRFMPAINEDLGATAVLGSQQAALDPNCQYDGIFGLWYGKGPGVDRSGDALRHGNAYGVHPKGGVLVVAGDDHGWGHAVDRRGSCRAHALSAGGTRQRFSAAGRGKPYQHPTSAACPWVDL